MSAPKYTPIKAGFDFKRLPGRTRPGSFASFRRGSTLDARADMANIIANYKTLMAQLKSVTPDAMLSAMQPVFDKSQEYVPRKTGALAESGILEVGTDNSGRPTVKIQYGDSSAPYAALVHEMVWLNHESPTRAKYLQSAMEEEFDSFLTSLAVDYMMVMGG